MFFGFVYEMTALSRQEKLDGFALAKHCFATAAKFAQSRKFVGVGARRRHDAV
jgi:hypothetical protein